MDVDNPALNMIVNKIMRECGFTLGEEDSLWKKDDVCFSREIILDMASKMGKIVVLMLPEAVNSAYEERHISAEKRLKNMVQKSHMKRENEKTFRKIGAMPD